MYFKKTLFVCLTIIMVLLFSSSALAESRELPVLLKMNHLFVLYTKPEGPYIDEQNRLMVPARTFCQKLIGANVNYDPKTKTVTIDFDGNSLNMTLDSTQYSVNGKHAVMDTVPVLKNGTVFIPLRTIIDAFHIKADWNKEYNYVSLDDDRIMKTELMVNMLDSAKGLGSNPDAFVPVNFKLEFKDLKDSWYWNYETTLKNVTGKDIPEGNEKGKEWVSTFFVVGNAINYTNPYNKGLAVKKDGVITKKGTVDYVKSNGGELELILLLGRTF